MDLLFYEVSARNGFQIEEAFQELSKKMLEKGQQRKASGFRITGGHSGSVRINRLESGNER